MSSCTLIPLARPTFDVAAAQRFFDGARAVLTDVGATINGPTSLVMTPEDTASAEAILKTMRSCTFSLMHRLLMHRLQSHFFRR